MSHAHDQLVGLQTCSILGFVSQYWSNRCLAYSLYSKSMFLFTCSCGDRGRTEKAVSFHRLLTMSRYISIAFCHGAYRDYSPETPEEMACETVLCNQAKQCFDFYIGCGFTWRTKEAFKNSTLEWCTKVVLACNRAFQVFITIPAQQSVVFPQNSPVTWRTKVSLKKSALFIHVWNYAGESNK